MTSFSFPVLEERSPGELAADLTAIWREENPSSTFTAHVEQRHQETAARNLRIRAAINDLLKQDAARWAICGDRPAYACLEKLGIPPADWLRGQMLYDLQIVLGRLREQGLLQRDSDFSMLRDCLVELGDAFTAPRAAAVPAAT